MKKVLLVLCIGLSGSLSSALDIRIQYPTSGDSLSQNRIRLAGWVSDTTAQLSVNGNIKRVYPTGAFVDLLNLVPGWNDFVIEAVSGVEQVSDTLRLYRIPPAPELPEAPVVFATERLLPATDQIYHAPDMIIVQFQGSPGGRAFFEIDDLTEDPLPMEELATSASGGVRGIYRGSYFIGERDGCDYEPVVFTLVGKNGDEEEWETDRHITVKLDGQPLIAETKSDNNIIFKAPWSEIIMELPAGVRLPVIAELGDWTKVCISDGLTGLISRRDVELLPSGTTYEPVSINGFSSRIAEDWLIFSFRLGTRVPFDIRQNGNNQLVLDLYRTYMHDEWTTLAAEDAPGAPDSSFLDYFYWEQVSDEILRFKFHFQTRQLWGFRGWYEDNNFKLAVRIPPQIDPDAPFRNLIIALDAGHGGDHPGAVGATGYMEKEANLIYTLDLAELLREAGAQVILTRDTDTTMWLRARADTARKYKAHILVWLHNNSIGSTTDPLAVSGASTYYTHLQGMHFALYVYPELLQLGLKPFGRVHRSYYITRQTDMVVFLVEGAFLSHPEDEMFLMDRANLKKLSQAVFNGMNSYLLSLAEK